MKTTTLEWKDFMKGELIEKKEKTPSKILPATLGAVMVYAPKLALAAAPGSSWAHLMVTAFGIADWLCIGVIIFSGVTWMFGNRTKALELLFGCASGYVIIRHAKDIQMWLGGL